jgi:hypothetical protein
MSLRPLLRPFRTYSTLTLHETQVFIGRAVLGWAASVSLAGAGLDLRFKQPQQRMTDGLGKGEDPHEETHEGAVWSFSHVGRRDQLFARLISIGDQKWESL